MMPDHMIKIDVKAEALVAPKQPDLLLSLMIDATGSMQPLIDAVRDAVRDIEEEARNKLDENNVPVDRLFAKVSFFRDLRFEESRSAWIESPIYNLSEQTELEAFETFLAAEIAIDGGDAPESSTSAIAYALTSDLDPALQSDNTLQAIIMWTDVAGIPLDDDTIVDDISVHLYKTEGALDQSTAGEFHTGDIVEGYTEDSFSGRTEPNSTYGCCSTLDILEREWRQGGTVALDNRVMAIIAPLTEEPWTQVSGWPNVASRPYSTPTVSGVLDDIISAMILQNDPLRVSN